MIDICKSRTDWLEKRVSGYFSSECTQDEMTAFRLKVIKTCEIDIALFEKTDKYRNEIGDLDLSFVLLNSNGRKFVTSSNRLVRRFIGSEHLLEPGEYLIVPCSFNFWYSQDTFKSKNNMYNLVIHSTKVFYLEKEMHSVFLLTDAMIQLVINLGSKTSAGLENASIYTLVKDFSGIIIVAENLNEKNYLHVELDCERSNNVVSTRQSLLTKDSVPPLHRQVLILLTQSEGSKICNLRSKVSYRLSSNQYLHATRQISNHPQINSYFHSKRSILE